MIPFCVCVGVCVCVAIIFIVFQQKDCYYDGVLQIYCRDKKKKEITNQDYTAHFAIEFTGFGTGTTGFAKDKRREREKTETKGFFFFINVLYCIQASADICFIHTLQ